MLAENLLKEIGFTLKQQQNYYRFKQLAGDIIPSMAKEYSAGNISFPDALKTLSENEVEGVHTYTLHLLFVLECTGFLLEKYKENNIDISIFINSMKDIKYKLDECESTKNVFGTFVADWYKGFLELRRFAFVRLQFDTLSHRGDDVDIGGFKLKEGDFFLNCHIPSSGPLTTELCEESFKKAYDYFYGRFDGKILPIRCGSWLLYPPYVELFGEKSNIYKFAQNFHLTEVIPKETFDDAWRVFGTDYTGDTKSLKKETSLQRSFVKYLEDKKSFGVGVGYVLFDGKNIITKG